MLIGLAATLPGCASLGYYAQAVRGHGALLSAAQPIDALLADPTTPSHLRQRLARAQEIRRFASQELGLPDNATYTSYADLGRPAAVWSVFATPELSLELRTWCYPLFGCAAYRGYFDRNEARRFADGLRQQGEDVNVAAVPAYSTLGWFSDPLLNTFINSNDGELARLLFHELAHQMVYAKGDTAFNESFATTVERVGTARWLAAQRDERIECAYAESSSRRTQFQQLMRKYRDELQRLYATNAPDAVKRARKRETFERMQVDYRRLRQQQWGGFAGYDGFFANLNNAHLAAFGAYHGWVPAFENLLARGGGDLPTFYEAVRRLARLDPAQRHAQLQVLSDASDDANGARPTP